MICVALVDTLDGKAVHAVVPQPADVSTCAYVLTSPAELSPWVMSQEQASELVVAIGLLWGFAFVCRSFVRLIQYTR